MEDYENNKIIPKNATNEEVYISSPAVRVILGDVFHKANAGNFKILIKNYNFIPSILEFLARPSKGDKSATLNEKIELIYFLTKNFQEVPFNQEIFSKFSINSRNSFSHFQKVNIFHILIDLYLKDLDERVSYIENKNSLNTVQDTHRNEEASDQLSRTILDCLEVLINNIVLKKEVVEFVYQKISLYYKILNKFPEEKSIQSKSLIKKIIDLLKILYGEKLNVEKPYNYFYFSGNGSLKVFEKALQEEKIKLNQGCVISFWLKPDLNLFDSKNSCYSCDLVSIRCNTRDGQKLQVSLVNNKLILRNFSDKEVVHEFVSNEWSHVSLILKPKSFLRSAELILLTDKTLSNHPIPNFNTDCDVTDICFFQNYVGQVTSIIFLNKSFSEEYVKLLRQMPYGIYKEKILQKFMKSSNNKYLTNSNKKFSNLPYTQKDSEGITNLIDNMKFCYTPFRQSNIQSSNQNLNEKTIFDLCGKYDAGFFNYDCLNGVHSYHSYQKNVFFLGGINNIIPLVEMIMCHGDLLENDTFVNLLELINTILTYRKKNMEDAVNKNFFPMLSLFLEKFPNELFQENILSILLTLGRSLFAFVDECKLSIIYFENILLNEKIFTKFKIQLQSELWRSLYQFYVSDVSQIKSFMKMSKVCLILRYYDINRYYEYCCNEHANVFNSNTNNDISLTVMQPDMPNKAENLINIVHLIVEENNLEEIHSLMKLLAMDLSPCLQKFIIKVFMEYFNMSGSLKVNDVIEKKQKTLHYLISHNFIDILLYVVSISLIDVRSECLKLFNNLSSPNFKEIMKKHQDKICSFLKEFILPFNFSATKMKIPLEKDSILLQNKKERSLGLYPNSERELKKSLTGFNKSKEIKLNQLMTEKNSDIVKRGITNKLNTEFNSERPLATTKASKKINFNFDSQNVDEYLTSSNIVNTISIREDSNQDEKGKSSYAFIGSIAHEKSESATKALINKKTLSIQVEDNNTSSIENQNVVETQGQPRLSIRNQSKNNFENRNDIDSKLALIINKSNSPEHGPNLSLENIPKLEKPQSLDPSIRKTIDKENKNKMTFRQHLKSMSVDLNSNNLDDFNSNTLKRKVSSSGNTFSSVIKDRKLNLGNMKIDVDNINKIYKFGGEKTVINMSEEEKNHEQDIQIRMLAKHCVDFMNGDATKTDCLRFNHISTQNAFHMKAMNDQYYTLQNEPRSVKGEKKIKQLTISLNRDKIIEEDDSEIVSSPFKIPDKRELSGKKTSDKKIIEKIGEKIENVIPLENPIENNSPKGSDNESNPLKEATTEALVEIEHKNESGVKGDKAEITATPKKDSSKGIQIVDDYLYSNTKALKDMDIKHDKELENLTLHFNKDIYNSNMVILFEHCFDWLLGKRVLKRKSISDLTQIRNDIRGSTPVDSTSFLDEEAILNPEVIDIIIRMSVNSDLTYLQKLMQDFYLIMLNNKENCSLFYKNSSFYTWLIETTFKHYQHKNNKEKVVEGNYSAMSMSIYEQGRRIHTELILNTVIKEEKLKSDTMNKINFLLSWGLYYKNLYDYNRKITNEVTDFLKSLFKDILNGFKEKLLNSSPNINVIIWQHFASFSILCYEFMTFYNLEKTLKIDSISLIDLLYENIIVPRCIFSGLNLDSSEKREEGNLNTSTSDSLNETEASVKKLDTIKELWGDYPLFESIYNCYSPIFNNYKTIFGNVPMTVEDSLSDNSFQKVLDEFLSNKKKRDNFLDDLRVLTYYFKSDFSSKFNNYDIPVLKIISNLMTITLTLIQDEEEIKYWLNQFENFLVFLIIASTNLTSVLQDYNQLVQELCIDVITFGICFLIDEYFNSRKNTKYAEYYCRSIKNVFVPCIFTLNFIYRQFQKKKKKINFITNLMKNKKKQDPSKFAIYRIFNEYILDQSGNPIMNQAKVQEIIKNGFDKVPEIFKEEAWRFALTESNNLREKLKKVFDFKVYDIIMKERNEVIKSFVPVYENKLTVNNGMNLVSSPYRDVSKALEYRNSIYKIIETMIPQYTFEIKKYNNNNFTSAKKRKQILKCLKKKIFSWRGMWSDYDVFYNNPEKLKLKILNHYTSQLSRPILSPLLDLNYYVPKFTKFNLENLFIKNDKNAELYVNLDIEEILNKKNEKSSECNMYKGFTRFNSVVEPELKFNYLREIYKLNHPIIWNSYTELNSKLNVNKVEHEYNELYLNKFKLKSTNPDLRKYENSYECCFVKKSHHIRGIFYLNKEGITFNVFLNQVQANNNTDVSQEHNMGHQNSIQNSLIKQTSFEVLEEDDHFDHERNTCYGSFFVNHHKDKHTLTYNFPYNEIKFILKRKYYLKKTGLEFFSTLNKSYYFNFKVPTDRDLVLKAIISHFESKREIKVDTKENVKDKEDLIIGYENNSNCPNFGKKNPKGQYFTSKVDSWINWKISNFEFLMWLNIYSNRSYHDLSQYPVFPWILKNYSDKIFSLPEDMRDFDVPMGMMELDPRGKERKILYLNDFFEMQEDKVTGQQPHMFGSHYSNPIYVSHYLTRIFPFSHIMIELQGDKFDDPNRLFLSLEGSFNCATSLKGDVRELTPEFFFLPEIFLNINNLNMGLRSDGDTPKQPVGNVQLPDWCDNNPYDYIIKIRTALESEEISLAINDWIDLIFGYKQKGKEAENNFNMFHHLSYEDAVKIETAEKERLPYYYRMVEFGVTPNQIFTSKSCVERFDKDHIRRGRQLTESKELKSYGNNQNTSKTNKSIKKPLMIKIKVLDNDKVICVYNDNTYNIFKITPNEYRYNMEIVSKNYINPEKGFRISCKINEYYNENLINCPTLIYNSGKVFN